MSSEEHTPEKSSAPANGADTKNEVRREIVELAKTVALFLVLFYALRTYVMEGYEVQGPSMEPNLKTGERILVLKLPYKLSRTGLFKGFQPIHPNDIVVFNGPDETSKRYVKRVIAVGPGTPTGNTVGAAGHDSAEKVLVRVEGTDVYVNNRRIEEDYVASENFLQQRRLDPVELHSGEYYMMGDNRDKSKDSRNFGPVQEDAVIGKAVLRFWPLSRFGFVK